MQKGLVHQPFERPEKRAPGWLGYIGDEILSSYIGIIRTLQRLLESRTQIRFDQEVGSDLWEVSSALPLQTGERLFGKVWTRSAWW